jgi:hypothetical protein
VLPFFMSGRQQLSPSTVETCDLAIYPVQSAQGNVRSTPITPLVLVPPINP